MTWVDVDMDGDKAKLPVPTKGKEVTLQLAPPLDADPGVYPLAMQIQSGEHQKSLPLLLEVRYDDAPSTEIDEAHRSFQLDPDKDTTLTLTITNHANQTREFLSRVEGVNPDWFRFADEDRRVSVGPKKERGMKIFVDLPENPKIRAGVYAFDILTMDFTENLKRTSRTAIMEVTRSGEYSAKLTPGKVNHEERSADYTLQVTNESNAPLQPKIRFADDPAPNAHLKLKLNEALPPVAPGETKNIDFSVLLDEKWTVEERMVNFTLVTEGTFQIRGKEEPIDRVDKRLGPQSVIWKQLGPALSISVAPSSLSVAPGDSPVLKLKIKNNSDKSHEVRLTFAGDGSDWFMPPSEPVKVGVHGEQAVEIPLKVPPERDRALAGNYALRSRLHLRRTRRRRPIHR